jgi:hypothetical protein
VFARRRFAGERHSPSGSASRSARSAPSRSPRRHRTEESRPRRRPSSVVLFARRRTAIASRAYCSAAARSSEVIAGRSPDPGSRDVRMAVAAPSAGRATPRGRARPRRRSDLSPDNIRQLRHRRVAGWLAPRCAGRQRARGLQSERSPRLAEPAQRFEHPRPDGASPRRWRGATASQQVHSAHPVEASLGGIARLEQTHGKAALPPTRPARCAFTSAVAARSRRARPPMRAGAGPAPVTSTNAPAAANAAARGGGALELVPAAPAVRDHRHSVEVPPDVVANSSAEP